jgi:hypothetical protein
MFSIASRPFGTIVHGRTTAATQYSRVRASAAAGTAPAAADMTAAAASRARGLRVIR